MSALLALLSSLSWGVSDFVGGVKAKDLPILTLLLAGQLVALLILGIWVVLSGSTSPSLGICLAAAGGGVGGVIGIGALYAAMTRHKFGLVAPISSLGVLLPVAFGLSRGESPGTVAIFGAILAVGGCVLAVWTPPEGGHTYHEKMGIALAFLAALGLGIALVGIGAASKHSPSWAVFCATAASVTTVLLAILWRRGTTVPRVAQYPYLFIIGALDAAAVIAYSLAARSGDISLASVLGSLSPAVIAILAVIFLHERLTKHQLLGAAAIVIGVAIISTQF